MSFSLGPHQRGVLKALKERGPWFAGCGWVWATRSRTIRILDALVARGLVTKAKSPDFETARHAAFRFIYRLAAREEKP